MKIQRAKKSDARKIAKLIRNTFNSILKEYYTPEQIKAYTKYSNPSFISKEISKTAFFIANEKNKLIGTIRLNGNEIAGLYVNNKIQGKGIGTKLLEHIEEYARKKKIKKLTLTATPYANPFYKKKGYKFVKTVILTYFGVQFEEERLEKKLLK